ncbi:class I SAM-dependent methyltransferase [Skermanella mucosa]|uniref:class I SAM-dependent methyltransferase n=1 Tax=Skermanella mucosa TaxID=1789672 RepID=UPI00192C82F5|nr:class I SAM-dependent methyltransferase [Skermanella mucosa]UEM21795.1 class I SAM-dependent methyltransferase [Skermanella mucosa]
MSYAELTYRSHNPLKRLVQGHRYRAMLGQVAPGADIRVLDYGCGDGFFLSLLQRRGVGPDRLTGYEPFASMAAQFAAGAGRPRLVEHPSGLAGLAEERFSHIFCMEVLEHLDDPELAEALDRIAALAGPETRIIVTVPSELGPAGAVKCLFRAMSGTERVDHETVRSVLAGRPPPRLVSDTPEGRYIYSHIGFDQRRVEAELASRFRVERRFGIPFRFLPLSVNNEVAFICRPR